MRLMVTVISRFRVRNGLENQVRAAFLARPRLVENENGFCGLDVLTDAADASVFYSFWELNKISVAQEHMATAVTQYAIASIYPKLIPDHPPRGEMVVTGVAGELHQIGANLVADAMESKGWNVRSRRRKRERGVCTMHFDDTGLESAGRG